MSARAAIVILIAATMLGSGRPVAQPRPPNIVFILADDLGVNDLAVYGRTEHRTPHIDRLAAEGMRFTTAYVASPICSPSRAAIMTGLSPARLHLTTYIPGRADAPSQRLLHPQMRQHLPLEQITLAERLRDHGYRTALIGKWHLGGQGFSPLEQGFDVLLQTDQIQEGGIGLELDQKIDIRIGAVLAAGHGAENLQAAGLVRGCCAKQLGAAPTELLVGGHGGSSGEITAKV